MVLKSLLLSLVMIGVGLVDNMFVAFMMYDVDNGMVYKYSHYPNSIDIYRYINIKRFVHDDIPNLWMWVSGTIDVN